MNAFVTQELSPIKFCFFVKPNQRNSFHKCVKLSQSYWGGVYNPIFPLYTKFSHQVRIRFNILNSERSFYSNFISNNDPDIIIYQDGLDKEYVKEISGDRKLIELSVFEDETESLDQTYGISIVELLYEITTTEFKFKRNDNLGISLPKQSTDIYTSMAYCNPVNKLHEQIIDALKDKDYITIIEPTIEDFETFRSSNNLTYRDILNLKLRKMPSFSDYYEFVFLFNSTDLHDLVVLWNLRAAGRKVLPVEQSLYNSGIFNEQMLDFYSNAQQHSPNVFKGSSIPERDFTHFIDYLSNVLKSKQNQHRIVTQGWIPRFGSSGEIAQKDGTLSSNYVHKSGFGHFSPEENHLSFPSSKADFNVLGTSYNLAYKNRITIQYSDPLKTYPSVIYGISGLDWSQISNDFGSEKYRISSSGIVRFCTPDLDNISFLVPTSFFYLTKLFQKYGAKIKESPGHKLSNQIYNNIQGEYGVHLFDSIGAIDVLRNLEGGKSIDHDHLLGCIKKYKPRWFEQRPRDFIEKLIEYKIVETGCVIQCNVCGQHSFYQIGHLSEELKCTQCSSSFSPALHDPKKTFKWSYRGVGPFSKNNKVDGLIPGFHTLRLFDTHFSRHNGTSALMNFELFVGNKNFEVDLFLQLRNKISDIESTEMIFCECKTYKRIQEKDINRLIFLGELVPNSILVLSTLNDSFTVEEKELITSLATHFRRGVESRPINPIFLLTSNELLPKNHDPFQHYNRIHTSVKYGDYLGYLCDQSLKHYLGIETWSDIQLRKWQQFQTKKQQNELS